MLMSELCENYSDGRGVSNKTKCFSAGNVFFLFFFSASFPTLLQLLSSNLISLKENATIAQLY